jgi:hypothetical protein
MRYKLLDVQWHIGHQYEMLKFPFVEWSWLMQYMRRQYSQSARGDLQPLFKPVLDYEAGRYDAAILHLDQECLSPYQCEFGKGAIYQDLNTVIQDIPKIVIMHGTPYQPEAREPYNDPEWMVYRLREIVGQNHLVVNSHQAARQWRMGLPIIHGLNSNEWFDLLKQPRVITTISKGGMPSYYDRPFLQEVREMLRRRGIIHCHIGRDYTASSWDDYRNMIGSSLIYFNPTKESPMPRARTEAMLSGCCVVTTPHHDADTFIRDGVNGFLVDRDVTAVVDLIEELIRDPERAIAIGQAGKQTAREMFNWERFAGNWKDLLHQVI